MIDAMHQRIAEIDGEIAALRAQRAQVANHVRWLRDQKKKRTGKQTPKSPKPRV
jgi:chorismate mutase